MTRTTGRYSRSFLKCIPVLMATLLVIGSASFAFCSMNTLDERDLSSITGQSGVTIYQGGEALVTIQSLLYSDTDHTPYNWIEFRNVTIDKDGLGNYFSFSTPMDYVANIDTGAPIVDYPITLDVGTDSTGRTLIQQVDSSNMNPRTFTVGTFLFCDQELGSLQLLGLTRGPDISRFGARSSGIDFDYTTQLYATSFEHQYNTSGDSLKLSGIHLAGSATGDVTDPTSITDPWVFSGNFKIGDIDNSNPATIDVGTNTSINNTAVFLNLPMQGTLRIEDVTFGSGNSFGPVAIDGINVHHLNVKIN